VLGLKFRVRGYIIKYREMMELVVYIKSWVYMCNKERESGGEEWDRRKKIGGRGG
jgi:hypothetical protein